MSIRSSGNNKKKICAIDGKQEDKHWSKHFKVHHTDIPENERSNFILKDGEDLKGEPWCDNWKETIADPKAKPINCRPGFGRGGDRKSQAGSIRGSSIQDDESAADLDQDHNYEA
jgi:hypothetical protein